MLKPDTEHAWDLPPKEAIALQSVLASRVRFAPPPERIETVGGIDVSIRRGNARAAVVVMALPELRAIERVWTDAPILNRRGPYSRPANSYI